MAAPDTPEGRTAWYANEPVDEDLPRRNFYHLYNFGEYIAGNAVAEIGRAHGKEPVGFREVCGICIQNPELYKILGADPAGIIATREYELDGAWRAGCIWLGTNGRDAAYVPFRYPLHDSYWFVFR